MYCIGLAFGFIERIRSYTHVFLRLINNEVVINHHVFIKDILIFKPAIRLDMISFVSRKGRTEETILFFFAETLYFLSIFPIEETYIHSFALLCKSNHRQTTLCVRIF